MDTYNVYNIYYTGILRNYVYYMYNSHIKKNSSIDHVIEPIDKVRVRFGFEKQQSGQVRVRVRVQGSMNSNQTEPNLGTLPISVAVRNSKISLENFRNSLKLV